MERSAKASLHERGDPNGIRTHFRNFAEMHNLSTTMRYTARYERNRKSASLHDSRRITNFQCPKLSEKLRTPSSSLPG